MPSSAAVLGESTVCTAISRNIHRGDESVDTTKLQSFLHNAGFLVDEVSGFYGDKTIQAVKEYQSSKGLPKTGMTYENTRQIIRMDTCGR